MSPTDTAQALACITRTLAALLLREHSSAGTDALAGRDGSNGSLRGTATPQRQADGSVLWHGYFEDVTEANAMAQAAHHERLAEAANRIKTEFLSRMSHELRTPLNAVLGFAQLLAIDQRNLQAAEPQHRPGLIRQAGEHLLAMIDDLLGACRALGRPCARC